MPQHSANIAPTWSQNEARDFQNRAQIEPGGAKKDDDDDDADDDADDDDNDAADDDDDDCDDDDADKPGMAPGSLQGPIFLPFPSPSQKITPGSLQRPSFTHFRARPRKWSQEACRDSFLTISEPKAGNGPRKTAEAQFYPLIIIISIITTTH